MPWWGNYILRKQGSDNEFSTIIESEYDTKAQELHLYAEDAGLDLLNEVTGPYKAELRHILSGITSRNFPLIRLCHWHQ